MVGGSGDCVVVDVETTSGLVVDGGVLDVLGGGVLVASVVVVVVGTSVVLSSDVVDSDSEVLLASEASVVDMSRESTCRSVAARRVLKKKNSRN